MFQKSVGNVKYSFFLSFFSFFLSFLVKNEKKSKVGVYRVPKCDVIKFSFFAFQHFHDYISVEHVEKLHTLNLT